MSAPSIQVITRSTFRGQMAPETMGIHNIQSPPVPKTHVYDPPSEDDEDAFDLFSVNDLYASHLHDVQQRLNEIHQEAEEANALDDEIDPVPNSAYNDAILLLEMLFACDIPMPDIGWAEDGSLGFEWRPDGGIATMGLYGDNLVIYTAFFGEERQVEGVCALSDTAMLIGFLTMLLPPLIRT